MKKEIKRIVIKIGSHLISDGKEKFISLIAEQVQKLKNMDCEIILVSSGAIATGIAEYNISTKPKTLVEKQAFAAIGQPLLMLKYIEQFREHKIKVSQVLLTRDDFDNRTRYLNIKNTLNHLLSLGVVPIINENDTVANDEIKLGDNDTLSAIVASKLEADLLIILTDVDGLYDKSPKKNSTAKIIHEVKYTDLIEKICSDNLTQETNYFCGTGGMKTKIEAAKIGCLSNIEVVIANGMKPGIILDIYAGEPVGTRFCPLEKELSSRKKWIAFGKKIKGRIIIDKGAVEAVKNKNKSLLPSGINFVEGNFDLGDVVSVCDDTGTEFARGIINFSSDIVETIKGKKTSEIKKLFPNIKFDEVIHKDNLVIL